MNKFILALCLFVSFTVTASVSAQETALTISELMKSDQETGETLLIKKVREGDDLYVTEIVDVIKRSYLNNSITKTELLEILMHKDKSEDAPIHWMARFNRLVEIKVFITVFTPLLESVEFNNLINQPGRHKRTPLHVATAEASTPVVNHLKSLGAVCSPCNRYEYEKKN